MTTQEVANQFYQWAQKGDWNKIQDELYSQEAESIEMDFAPVPHVKGMEAIKQKGVQWGSNIKEMHSGYCKEPIVAGNHFTCTMGTEYTDIQGERQNLDEVCVYQVENGKIVKEQFFY